MRFKIRALALALMALAASGAMMASAAQAGQFTAESYPATLTGTQLSGHEFSFFNYSVRCTSASFDGSLAAGSETLTIGAAYEECESGEGDPVTVKMTGCDYVFRAGNSLGVNEVDGTMGIKCPAGAGVDFENAVTGCDVKIQAQGTLSTLVYTNRPEAKDFDVDINVANFKYDQDAQCFGGVAMFFNGAYTGQVTMTGDHEGAGTGVKVD
jgi:hypothetical protein